MEPDPYKTSASLIQAIKDQCDASSWERFYHIYHPLLFRYSCSLGLSPTDAEDLVQETVVSVSKSIETFQYDPQRSSFKGWLFTIIKRKFIDLRRSQKRKKHLLHTDLDQSAAEISMMSAEASQGEGPDQQLWERDWEAFVKERTFKRLKERFKIEYLQIFDLAVTREWSTSRIAEHLKISKASVYLKLHRMRRALKKERQTLLEADF